jgi:hypothetical protein
MNRFTHRLVARVVGICITDVDSMDCNESGISFHEGASELTCYP